MNAKHIFIEGIDVKEEVTVGGLTGDLPGGRAGLPQNVSLTTINAKNDKNYPKSKTKKPKNYLNPKQQEIYVKIRKDLNELYLQKDKAYIEKSLVKILEYANKQYLLEVGEVRDRKHQPKFNKVEVLKFLQMSPSHYMKDQAELAMNFSRDEDFIKANHFIAGDISMADDFFKLGTLYPELLYEKNKDIPELDYKYVKWLDVKPDSEDYNEFKKEFTKRYIKSVGAMAESEETKRIVLKTPNECSEEEINDFYDMLVLQNEVTTGGLKSRIRNSYLLGFAYENDDLKSILAIKKPLESYVQSVFQKAGVPEEANNYKKELGWFYTKKDSRGFISMDLLMKMKPIIDQESNIFITTKNPTLILGLKRMRFSKIGNSYPSKNGGDISLFVK